MIKRIGAAVAAFGIGAVLALVPTAAAQASHCNWSCKTGTDAYEARSNGKVTGVAGYHISSTAQETCEVEITNDGYAGHWMRFQIITRNGAHAGEVQYDTGYHGIYLGPGQAAWRNPKVYDWNVDEDYVKLWNDVGDVTWLDYWYNTADDAYSFLPLGTIDSC